MGGNVRPRWRNVLAGLAVGVAVLAAVLVLLLGLLLLSLELQPDTGQGEDIGRGFGLAILFPLLGLFACLSLGGSVACAALNRGWMRRTALTVLLLTFAGIGFAVIPVVVGASQPMWP